MAVTLSHLSLSCGPSASSVSQSQRRTVEDQAQHFVSAPVSRSTGSIVLKGNGVCHSARSSFAGDVRQLTASVWSVPKAGGFGSRPLVVAAARPVIQFIRGINEQTVPDVKLTRSRDGTNGVANFEFDQPSVFDSSRELGDITGLYMIDEEGTLSSVDVSAKFVNGKPAKIEARYVMRNIKEWDRFMRFMERYANENELGFVKKQ
ncbi:photosystem II 13kDa protein [Marchantia polymorpha subsp. ruderalis]|uniref:Photosystem II reaction center Psb28 protein n=1 Tax=Marchantia polymorpha TaxID=3197 RepID=A0A2R6X1S2_MARPO|nr:hypothetical protein MARPO_0042s0085 [Marchantia polymorpha]BBN02355.1 hypothetical protein Mp_2g14630 [Marchantia polymorpha subsp. ruderalis]|eukprot:PTQ40050.1 hypothetical protein MARPO_0042s0085 [Marchantia polymorpha]